MFEAAAGIDEAAEIVERAELGMHRVVAALPAADGVGAAGIVGRGLQRIVAGPCGWSCRSDGSASDRRRRSRARRSRAAARCNRRRCRGGPAPCPGCAAPSRTRRRRARAAGRRSPGSAMLRVRSPRGSLAATASASSSVEQDLDVGGAVELRAGRARSIRLCSAIASIQFAEKFAAFAGLKRDIKAGLALEQQCFAPGGELVGPGFDREQVAAGLGRGEAGRASGRCRRSRIGSRCHSRLGFLPPQQLGGELVVALAQQIGPHLDRLRRRCA